MTLQSSILELQLEKLTYGGKAMGHLEDGRAVFIPFALPGERVRVRLTEERRNFARGELSEILEASLHKVAPRVIAYVSCDPSTPARDVARLLRGGYHLKDVTPFDLFPQTFHIETISIFKR